MKSLLFLFISLLTFGFAKSQESVKFKETEHVFGKIKHNEPKSYSFSFKNNGTKPLIVESAVAGCGCTTPEFPKTPILKGKEGKIKVTYNAASIGTFKKDVTVKFANIAQPTILKIEGEVLGDK